MEDWIEPDLEKFQDLCSIFEGEHDWANYCRREPGRSTKRVIESCKPWINSGRIIGFEIVGEAFVWNQVRRIANAILGAVTGYRTVDKLIEARDNPGTEIDLGLADPDWLILWSVTWEGFRILNQQSRKSLFQKEIVSDGKTFADSNRKRLSSNSLISFKDNTNFVSIF